MQLSLTLLALAVPQLGAGRIVAPPDGSAASLAPGAVQTQAIQAQRIVGVSLGSDPDDLFDEAGAEVLAVIGDGTSLLSAAGPAQLELLQFATPGAAAAGELALISSDAVVFVERNRLVSAPETCEAGGVVSTQQCTAAFFDGTPTEPEYTDQLAVPAIQLDATTEPPSGSGMLVAVIDTGLDFQHPLLADRFASYGYDFVLDRPLALDLADGIDDDGDGDVDEGAGHGTFVAGLIALVDPTSMILPYRVLDSEGNGTAWDVAAAIHRATLDGADVINLSLRLAGPSRAVEEAIEFATDEAPSDVAVVAAAGNTGGLGVSFPAAYPGVVAVAALDAEGVVAEFSAFGPEVTVSAPGVDLYSAMPGGQFAVWSGTSMSAALVSGAKSRLQAFAQGQSGPEDTTEALEESAASVDELNPLLAGLLGAGRIQVASAGASLLDDD